jgi:hypothetical protein
LETREIAEQEDFESVLAATLSKGWADQYGERFEINGDRGARRGQEWFLQPTFTTLYTSDVSRAARSFMVARFKYTPVTARAPFQWMLGTALGSRLGLSLRRRRLLSVHPPVPGAANVLIVPGSRRVRTFDLTAGLSRSFLKAGYPVGAIANEVAVRGSEAKGPFFPVIGVGGDHTWFEEPIVDGFPLPRCPPWWPRERYASLALQALDEWLSRGVKEVAARVRAEELVAQIAARRQGLLRRFPDVPLPKASLLESLALGAEWLGDIELAQSHGDLQPGNIHVGRRPRRVYLIDWEHTDRRFRSYDFLTFGLRARYPKGLGVRILRFITEQPTELAFEYLPRISQQERAAMVALFLLEELNRSVADAARTPYRTLPYGFRQVCREITSIEEELGKSVPKRLPFK